MPLYQNQKSFAVASGGVHFKSNEEKAVKRVIPIKGTLNYDNLQSGLAFSFSLKVKGGTSGATATVQLFDDELLYLTDIIDIFQDGEEIQDLDSTYIADADGVVDYFLTEEDPAPYPDSGLVQSDEIIFAEAETKTINVHKKALMLELLRISACDVTVYLDNTSNTPGLFLEPGEYQHIKVKPYEVNTIQLVSSAAGSMVVRQLHE